MKRLIDLFQTIEFSCNFKNLEIIITDICSDTRKIHGHECLFFAINGIDSDGHNYIAKAIENGVNVIVGSRNIDEIESEFEKIKYIQIDVSKQREIWAILCKKWLDYDDSMNRIIALTGTDGKTSTAGFISQILKQSGLQVGIIGTTGIFLNEQKLNEIDHTTTPDIYEIYKYLTYFKEKKVDYVVMEITSFAVLQKRVFGLRYSIAGITNLTHEHLDQHKTYENYAECKAEVLNNADLALINYDEIHHNKQVFTNLSNLHNWNFDIFKALNVNLDTFKKHFIGEYNVKNLALCLTILINIKDKELILQNIQKKINTLKSVEGRLNYIPNNLGITIIIDYAHTPHGMKSLLEGVREKTNKSIHCVFGCEGRRDEAKRAMMGNIAKSYCEYSYLSPVDPRDVDVKEINSMIEDGWRRNPENPEFKLYKFDDRKIAIKQAILDANPGDFVLLLGKGHEKTMNYGNGEVEYSDFEAVEEILE